eukprot:GHVU01225091.1.p1 GENE.GHVU01225091.1~~GHVU01225091.1.p1  ORF type:complete len:230 (+),score=23.09 GHVU01225091.1:190-879(+)
MRRGDRSGTDPRGASTSGIPAAPAPTEELKKGSSSEESTQTRRYPRGHHERSSSGAISSSTGYGNEDQEQEGQEEKYGGGGGGDGDYAYCEESPLQALRRLATNLNLNLEFHSRPLVLPVGPSSPRHVGSVGAGGVTHGGIAAPTSAAKTKTLPEPLVEDRVDVAGVEFVVHRSRPHADVVTKEAKHALSLLVSQSINQSRTVVPTTLIPYVRAVWDWMAPGSWLAVYP